MVILRTYLLYLSNISQSSSNRGSSEGSETSAQDGSTRQIWFCFVYFCLGNIWSAILKRGSKINFTKIDNADLNSHRGDLFVQGLGIVLALSVHWWLIFRVRLLGLQFSCRHCVNIMVSCQCKEPSSQKRRGSVHPRQGIPLTSYVRTLMSYKHISNVFTLPLNKHASHNMLSQETKWVCHQSCFFAITFLTRCLLAKEGGRVDLHLVPNHITSAAPTFWSICELVAGYLLIHLKISSQTS